MDMELVKELLLIAYSIAKEITIWITMIAVISIPTLIESVKGVIQ